jgi:chromosome segregation ATPase
MALIQRYSTELSAYTGTNHNASTSISEIVNDVASIKRHDEDEKHYFNSLNDRLEEFLRSLDDLELANKNLRDELNLLITSWGIGGENRIRFLQELDVLIQQLSQQNLRKVIILVETRIFDELTRLTDRITSIFLDVFNSYEDKKQILFDLIKQLEDELYKIQIRLNISNTQIKSHDDDFQKELTKFRSYLSEWSKITLDKQNLLNEIQTLKEYYNLRLSYNQEEINEWKRLLNHISQESNNFYRDYLETIKQQIQIDYEQMAKEQQDDVEFELKTRLKEIEEKIQLGLPIDENGLDSNSIFFFYFYV